jgi:hypothetical protein
MPWSAAAATGKFQFFVFRRRRLKNYNCFCLSAAATRKIQFFSDFRRRRRLKFLVIFSKIFLVSKTFEIKKGK